MTDLRLPPERDLPHDTWLRDRRAHLLAETTRQGGEFRGARLR